MDNQLLDKIYTNLRSIGAPLYCIISLILGINLAKGLKCNRGHPLKCSGRAHHKPITHPHAPITPNFSSSPNHEIVGGSRSKIDVGPSLFTLLQLEMLVDDARSGWCEQFLTPHL